MGEATAAAALAHRYGWTVAPDVDAADALAVALPAGTLGGAADTAVRTALRRGLPILVQIGGDLAAFPDCWAVPVPGGYRLLGRPGAGWLPTAGPCPARPRHHRNAGLPGDHPSVEAGGGFGPWRIAEGRAGHLAAAAGGEYR